MKMTWAAQDQALESPPRAADTVVEERALVKALMIAQAEVPVQADFFMERRAVTLSMDLQAALLERLPNLPRAGPSLLEANPLRAPMIHLQRAKLSVGIQALNLMVYVAAEEMLSTPSVATRTPTLLAAVTTLILIAVCLQSITAVAETPPMTSAVSHPLIMVAAETHSTIYAVFLQQIMTAAETLYMTFVASHQ